MKHSSLFALICLAVCPALGQGELTQSQRRLPEQLPHQPAGTISFSYDGGFVINAGGREFSSGSCFSKPGGGWYRLGKAVSIPGVIAPWHIQRTRQTKTEWEGTAETKQYRLHRAIRFISHRVQVKDTLTNLSDKDLGWMIRHELTVPTDDSTGTPTVHLGGDGRLNPSPAYSNVIKEDERVIGIDCWRPSNPTVFVPLSHVGVGLSIEDDVTRVHALTYWRKTAPSTLTAGFRDECFALPPGGEYTTRWSVYIIPGENKTYYDFINQLRADWKLNDICIPGPTIWSSFILAMNKMTDEQVQSRLLKSGAWAVATSLNGWMYPARPKTGTDPKEKVQVGFGPGVLDPYFDDLRDSWTNAAERIHRLAPNVKVMHYFHTFLYDPQRDPESFKDSWITRSDGTRAITDWGKTPLTPSAQVFPTSTNAVGRDMLQVLDMMIGSMKGNGIYFDEVNYPSGIGWLGSFPCTYNDWDGYSAVLDSKTFAIIKKTGFLELLSADFKKKLFDRIADLGGVILGNGAPDVWWENGLKFPRHTECRQDPYPRAYESHLYSPIALVEDRSFKHTREMLKYGVIDCFVRLEDPDLSRQEHIIKSFPLTVQEIHEGWLKGKERIITIVPGIYSWNEATRARIYEFAADGKLAATREATSTNDKFDIKIPRDGMVIMERIASE